MAAPSIRSATGVLPIALGEATKTVAYVMDGRKHYRFTARWGEARTTDDAEGEVARDQRAARPSSAEIEAALPRLRRRDRAGAAALRRDQGRGRARLRPGAARRGGRARRRARSRSSASTWSSGPIRDHVVFEVVCGRGTYVRALVRDLGAALGCLGHVGRAAPAAGRAVPRRRRRITLDGARAGWWPTTRCRRRCCRSARALGDLPALALTEPQADRLRAGQTDPGRARPAGRRGRADDATVRAMAAGQMVALARLQGGELSPVRVFNF